MITLSPRLQQVVDRMLLGEKSPRIAFALGMTRSTVATYQKRIYATYGVHSQIELVAKVRKERNTDLVESLKAELRQHGGGVISVTHEFARQIVIALEAP